MTAAGGGAYRRWHGDALRQHDQRQQSGSVARRAAYGGGSTRNGAIALHASTIDSNIAHSVYAPAYGGGVHSPLANISIVEGSTISGNTARSDTTWSYGGGVSSGIDWEPYSRQPSRSATASINGNAANSACSACLVSGAGVHAFDSIAAEYATVELQRRRPATTRCTQCSTTGGGLVCSRPDRQASKITLRNATISGQQRDRRDARRCGFGRWRRDAAGPGSRSSPTTRRSLSITRARAAAASRRLRRRARHPNWSPRSSRTTTPTPVRAISIRAPFGSACLVRRIERPRHDDRSAASRFPPER